LDAFAHLLREAEWGKTIDRKVFRQILYYLNVVPERYHHPKGDLFLFAPLRQRTHEADALLARLEHQHVMGMQSMKDLEQLMSRRDAGGEAERQAFISAAARLSIPTTARRIRVAQVGRYSSRALMDR